MRCLMFVVVVWTAVASHAPAADFPLDEYDLRATEYLSRLANLTVRVTDTDQTRDGSVTMRTEITIQTIADHFHARQVRRTTPKDGAETTTVRHSILRPDGYFSVREREPGVFALEHHLPEVTRLRQVGGDSPLQPLTAPICRLLRPLPPILRGELPGFQVRPTAFRPHGDRAELTTQDTINGTVGESRFEFNAVWLITRAQFRAATGDRSIEQRIEYTTFRGALVPSRVVAQVRGGAANDPPPNRIEFDDYAPFDGSRADFSLRRFGIPEVVGYDEPPPSRVWLYLLATSVVFVGTWIAFARRSRRVTSTP